MQRALPIALLSLTALWLAVPAAAAEVSAGASTHELAAQQSRPRITIYPRQVRPGPNAKRQCRSTLVQEARASGTVIVPQMRCWWE